MCNAGGEMTKPENAAPLLIKRYASRRLYNTESSDYVTLEDIAGIIRSGRQVQIVDLKSGDDLTRQYLLQIIAEHESRGEAVLPLDVLTDLVRSYSPQSHSIVPQFLATSFQMLRDSQSQMIENFSAFPSPIATLPGFETFKRQQEMFLKAVRSGWDVAGSSGPELEDDDDDKSRNKAGRDDDMNEIRRQLTELQKKISKL